MCLYCIVFDICVDIGYFDIVKICVDIGLGLKAGMNY